VSHAAGEAAWAWDLGTERVLRGGALAAITGYGPEEIGSDLGWWRERIHPEDRASVLASLDSALSGERRELVLLYRFLRKDGTHTLLLDRAFVLGEDPARPERIVGVVREVPATAPAPAQEPVSLPPESAASAALGRITDPSLSYLSLDLLVTEMLDRLRSGLHADAVLVFLFSENHGDLECAASAGVLPASTNRIRVQDGEGVVGRVAASGRPLLTDRPRTEGGVPRGWGRFCRSFAGVPIILEGVVVGVIGVVWRRRRAFDGHDLRLLEVAADRVGPALERTRLQDSVRVDRDRLGVLSRNLVASMEEERRQVSREMHDEIGQLLTSLRLTLQSGDDGRVQVEQILDDLFARVRNVATTLRPPMLDDMGLGTALTWHCERFSNQTGVRVHVTTTGLQRRYRPEVELAVFRVVQEALTNVARHAGVREARVSVRGSRALIAGLVVDSGVGFTPGAVSPKQSSGLIGMRERIASVGGRIFVASTPGCGTRVSLFIPFREGAPSSSEVP
jgi:signal transduction histidine kinase